MPSSRDSKVESVKPVVQAPYLTRPRTHLGDGLLEGIDGKVYFFKRHTERQHENDDVTDRTREQTVTSRGKTNLRAYLVTPIERDLRFAGRPRSPR